MQGVLSQATHKCYKGARFEGTSFDGHAHPRRCSIVLWLVLASWRVAFSAIEHLAVLRQRLISSLGIAGICIQDGHVLAFQRPR